MPEENDIVNEIKGIAREEAEKNRVSRQMEYLENVEV